MRKRDQEGRGGVRKGIDQKRRSISAPAYVPTREGLPVNLDLKKLEKIWAKEYLDKPKDVRERLTNELHGVSSRAVTESPEMIASALELFQEAVDRAVPESEKWAYYRACSMNSTYVQSVAFRLKFLRAELFDPKKAALRYARNLNYLGEKFGDFALMRQLYLTDLNSEEKRFFKKGYMQILPFRDSVGRRIIVNIGSYGGSDFSNLTRARVGAYLNYAILAEDETTQRKGAISLGLLDDDATESVQLVELSEFDRFIQAMPIRFTGYHTCLDNSIRSRVMKALLLTFIQGEARVMTRIHIGTQVECDYVLRSFGIPTEHIPRSSTGTIKDGYHKANLKMRSLLDDHRKGEACNDYRRYYSSSFVVAPFHAIECPCVNSFLVRRNGAAWNYPGNIRVRDFLEEKLFERKRLDEGYMSSITKEIMTRDIQILVYDDAYSWYTRVTRKKDIQKQVLYIMREIRKRKRIKANSSLQSNECSTDAFQGLADQQCKMVDSCCLVSNDEVRPIDI